jgi:hypothetical protein
MHSRIDTLDLRTPQGQMIGAKLVTIEIIEALRLIFIAEESWMDWDEIQWEFPLRNRRVYEKTPKMDVDSDRLWFGLGLPRRRFLGRIFSVLVRRNHVLATFPQTGNIEHTRISRTGL